MEHTPLIKECAACGEKHPDERMRMSHALRAMICPACLKIEGPPPKPKPRQKQADKPCEDSAQQIINAVISTSGHQVIKWGRRLGNILSLLGILGLLIGLCCLVIGIGGTVNNAPGSILLLWSVPISVAALAVIAIGQLVEHGAAVFIAYVNRINKNPQENV